MAPADLERCLELVIAAVLNHTGSEFDKKKKKGAEKCN